MDEEARSRSLDLAKINTYHSIKKKKKDLPFYRVVEAWGRGWRRNVRGQWGKKGTCVLFTTIKMKINFTIFNIYGHQ